MFIGKAAKFAQCFSKISDRRSFLGSLLSLSLLLLSAASSYVSEEAPSSSDPTASSARIQRRRAPPVRHGSVMYTKCRWILLAADSMNCKLAKWASVCQQQGAVGHQTSIPRSTTRHDDCTAALLLYKQPANTKRDIDMIQQRGFHGHHQSETKKTCFWLRMNSSALWRAICPFLRLTVCIATVNGLSS